MTGVFLGAAAHRVPVVIDGVISIAAALLACKASPLARDFMIASHLSKEPGYGVAAEHLQLTPLLNLGMRLGEGSGAMVAYPILCAALAFMNEMASFESAGVSKSVR